MKMRPRPKLISPVFLIISGTAEVVMEGPHGKEVIGQLRSGDVFGISDLLKIIVSSYFLRVLGY